MFPPADAFLIAHRDHEGQYFSALNGENITTLYSYQDRIKTHN